LATEVEKVYRVPVKVENDANAAALAEARWGAGRGYRHIFYAGVGTGIGSGIVFDGKIYNGRTGAAAEGGHMSIAYDGPRCGCGKPGCIEILAAGPAIARRARAKLACVQGPRSAILDLAKGNIEAGCDHSRRRRGDDAQSIFWRYRRWNCQVLHHFALSRNSVAEGALRCGCWNCRRSGALFGIVKIIKLSRLIRQTKPADAGR
jgi:hypothetical protein